MILWHF